ncbi:tail protein [Eggerthella phage LE2-3]|jgi:hypothetical protein|nr:tail protein [Eggerthella phage LE2-3]DAV16199.1 MAG TPA: hypothetical protein [Caudoviricetes sp.]
MLGKYFVPTDDDKYAGVNEAETRGEGTNGLQGAFEAACRLFAADLEKNYNGLTIDFGYSGYVSKESAERWAEDGNVKFLQYIHYFGYGLAWEFSLIDVGERTKLNAVNAISSYALKYNLSVNVYDSGGFLFVTPRYVQSKDGITASEYGGDADSTEEAEAQGGGANSSSGSLASTAWFFASSFGDTMNAAASQLLVGERALANDEPVWNTVKDIFNSSMRTVMAGPDGTFMAWYPDYWGVSGNTPCLLLDDIELIDLKITQSDDTFVSHQFCAGVNTGGQYLTSSGQTSDMQWALTQGVVSIESNTAALSSGVLNDVGENAISNEPSELLKKLINIPEGEEWRFTPRELYRRYGARPAKKQLQHVIEKPNDSGTSGGTDANPQYILPFLYALYEFMRNWANQYQMSLQITWMPNIWPGMRVKVKSLGLSGYVTNVQHSGGPNAGQYSTSVTLVCPQCEKGDTRFPGMVSWEK